MADFAKEDVLMLQSGNRRLELADGAQRSEATLSCMEFRLGRLLQVIPRSLAFDPTIQRILSGHWCRQSCSSPWPRVVAVERGRTWETRGIVPPGVPHAPSQRREEPAHQMRG